MSSTLPVSDKASPPSQRRCFLCFQKQPLDPEGPPPQRLQPLKLRPYKPNTPNPEIHKPSDPHLYILKPYSLSLHPQTLNRQVTCKASPASQNGEVPRRAGVLASSPDTGGLGFIRFGLSYRSGISFGTWARRMLIRRTPKLQIWRSCSEILTSEHVGAMKQILQLEVHSLPDAVSKPTHQKHSSHEARAQREEDVCLRSHGYDAEVPTKPLQGVWDLWSWLLGFRFTSKATGCTSDSSDVRFNEL